MTQAVIIRPLITEKSLKDAKSGKFTFVVHKNASKLAIKQEVQDKFNVTVVAIATAITKGKGHRVGKKRIEVKKSAMKKAVVKVATGQKISLFEAGE